MHLILTGATGLVGTSVLAHVISTASQSSPAKVTRLSILSRKPDIPYLQRYPLDAASPLKIDIIHHEDFESYPPGVLDRLKGADGVVWALGVSQNDVKSEAEYVQITRTYALKAAEAFKSIPESGSGSPDSRFKFVYVSGAGVTQSPGRFTPLFGRVKGETEKALLDLAKSDARSKFRVYNPRPAVVDPKNQPDVAEVLLPKFLNTMGKKVIYHTMLPVVRATYSSLMSPTEDLGKALTDLAVGDGEPISKGTGVENDGWTLENVALKRIVVRRSQEVGIDDNDVRLKA